MGLKRVDIKEGAEYSLQIHNEARIAQDDFSDCIGDLSWWKTIITFWEEHNLNTDESFSEILRYEGIIFFLYREKNKGIPFRDIMNNIIYALKEDKGLFEDFLQFSIGLVGNQNSLPCSSSRIFACLIIPELAKRWFKDLVFEWMDESSPEKNFKLSKDKIGYLMILLMSMTHEVSIHGAYDSTLFVDAIGIAREFERIIDKITVENPKAKVMTYNGWVHNMTVPIEWEYRLFWIDIDLSELSFAPYLRKKYRDAFLSVDLVDTFWSQDNSSHYAFLKQKAKKDSITLIDHSDWQKAFIFPTNATFNDRVGEILRK